VAEACKRKGGEVPDPAFVCDVDGVGNPSTLMKVSEGVYWLLCRASNKFYCQNRYSEMQALLALGMEIIYIALACFDFLAPQRIVNDEWCVRHPWKWLLRMKTCRLATIAP
jgi:hypothetical protein